MTDTTAERIAEYDRLVRDGRISETVRRANRATAELFGVDPLEVRARLIETLRRPPLLSENEDAMFATAVAVRIAVAIEYVPRSSITRRES